MDGLLRFDKLQQQGIFRDFTWPSELSTFRRFNLVYGWNGTGKSTLARILQKIELKKNVDVGQVRCTISNNPVDGVAFSTASLPAVRVFNREYIAANVFAETRNLAPIFVLGQESVEKQKEAQMLRAKIDEKTAAIAGYSQKETELKISIERLGTDKAKVIKDTLTSNPPGFYNTYFIRPKFEAALTRLRAEGNGSARLLDDASQADLRALIGTSIRKEVELIDFTLPKLGTLLAEVVTLLHKTVVSNAIESLKDNPKLAGWVQVGLAIHRATEKEPARKTCGFCNQEMPTGRLGELESHFNTAFTEFQAEVKRKADYVQGLIDEIDGYQPQSSALLYDRFVSEYTDASVQVSEQVEAARLFLSDVLAALQNKAEHLNERLAFDHATPADVLEPIAVLNAVIAKHNAAVKRHDTDVAEARTKLENHFVAEAMPEITALEALLRQVQASLIAERAALADAKTKLEQAEKFILNHRPPADEMNRALATYLGHADIKLKTEDTGYRVVRNGEPAESLSEGEQTAIALLYFLHSLRDRQCTLAETIIVLDDPVSSLDTNAMYSAVAFIRDKLKGVGQLFIFTHNFTFFREVRSWFEAKCKEEDDEADWPSRFYMLECPVVTGVRSGNIRALDPLLQDYHSEYHYLFATLLKASNPQGSSELSQFYGVPNMARRLLETFLAFRVPGGADQNTRLQKLDFDEAAKTRLSRFLNAFSHHDRIGEPEHDMSLLAETPAILKSLFDMIRATDEQHFVQMEALVAS